MSDRGLFTIACCDLKASKIILSHSDEISINIAAYHVQQFVEKALKYCINLTGNDYKKVHQIDILLEDAMSVGVTVPQFVIDNYETFNIWATRSRYNDRQLTSKLHLHKIIELCEEWMHALEQQVPQTLTTSHRFNDK